MSKLLLWMLFSVKAWTFDQVPNQFMIKMKLPVDQNALIDLMESSARSASRFFSKSSRGRDLSGIAQQPKCDRGGSAVGPMSPCSIPYSGITGIFQGSPFLPTIGYKLDKLEKNTRT